MKLDLRGLADDDRVHSAGRYLLVGVVSYGIDVGVLSLFWHVLHAPLWLSTSAGFWSSFAANFVLSRNWTFRQNHQAPGAQLLRYSVLVAVNYTVTVFAVTALHRSGFGVITARTLVLAVLTLSTYFLYRKWVFAKRDVSDE